MLSRWLSCRERFRVRYLLGWRPVRGFDHRTGYGTMWHLCEEYRSSYSDDPDGWQDVLKKHVKALMVKYQTQKEEIYKWYRVCLTQFPVYLDHWRTHPGDWMDQSLAAEAVLDVPYTLPSGRKVRLRGKIDDLGLIRSQNGLYVLDHKTKGDIEPGDLTRQLTWDLQTMMYLTMVREGIKVHRSGGDVGLPEDGLLRFPPDAVKGILYNVVRRPLSGGKGSIVQHKPTKSRPQGETADEYYERLGGVIRENAEHFFFRLRCEVHKPDVDRFRAESLDPILEAVCNWYDFITNKPTNAHKMAHGLHWRHPFGVANTVDEYGWGDLDAFLESGSTVGLEQSFNPFEELTV